MNHRIVLGIATAALVALVRPAAPQARGGSSDVPDDVPKILGATVSTSGTERDTLGLLVSAVTPGGPADRASIDPGNRLAEVNDVSLRIDQADVGRRQAQDAALRRLAHELRAVQPGDSVTLRVFAGGRFRTVTIQTARTVEPRSEPTPRPATLKAVIDGISEMRAQLHRLMQDEAVAARRDTLMLADLELGTVERRLRAAQGEPRHDESNAQSLPGLRTTAVGDELVAYFGEDSRGGLLVVEADSSWAPIRTGDVILSVDGEAADIGRLRNALDPRRETRVELLRRGRSLTVRLHPGA
ncbi:MAG: hypothetical protein DMD34_08275 [Gemmatimonadetes bacterium]|nr:MAG: hypothetical protein DMD34_08275 [Gemmatimonadota bacterium]